MHNIYSSLKHLLLHFSVIKYKRCQDLSPRQHIPSPSAITQRKKLITAAVPSSPHYSPWAWALPQSISVSSTQGKHQFGLSQRSKTQDICQDNLPLFSQSSSQPVLMEIMFSCKCHMEPSPVLAGRVAVQHLSPAPGTLILASLGRREVAPPAWDTVCCPAFHQDTLCSSKLRAPPSRNHQEINTVLEMPS